MKHVAIAPAFVTGRSFVNRTAVALCGGMVVSLARCQSGVLRGAGSGSHEVMREFYQYLCAGQRGALRSDWDYRVNIPYVRKPLSFAIKKAVLPRTHTADA
jgi:hypothetical protein